jgi:hypothetical protein
MVPQERIELPTHALRKPFELFLPFAQHCTGSKNRGGRQAGAAMKSASLEDRLRNYLRAFCAEDVERVERDMTGRCITRFFGDPECCWGPFKQPFKRLLGIAGDRR